MRRLARTLPARGAFVPNYYGIGHASLDNYIAMIGGQAPNPSTQADCGVFANFTAAGPLGSFGQQPGTDIYKRQCGPSPPRVTRAAAFFLRAPHTRAVLQWTVSTKDGTPLAYSQLHEQMRGGWRTVLARTTRTSYSFVVRVNHTYDFRVRAVNTAGQTGRWTSGLVVGSVT